MCPPVIGALGTFVTSGAAATGSAAAYSAGLATLSIGSSALGFIGQRKQARAMERNQAIAMQQERERAARQMLVARQREAQENISALQQKQRIAEESRQAMARALVSAGESNVGGQSTQAVLDEFSRQEGRYLAALEQQQQFQAVNLDIQLGDIGLMSESNITALNRPIDSPNFITSAFQAAEKGATAYARGQQYYDIANPPSLEES